MPVTVGEIALVMFVGMGPIKVLVFYLGAIREATPAVAREVALRAVVVATITVLGLVLVGSVLMRLLHFSTAALIVAGGIVLLAYGLQMVLTTTPGGPVGAPTRAELMRMAIYPMAVPLILNPAGVAAATIFSAEAVTLGDLGVVVLIVLALAVLDLAVLVAVRPIGPRLGPETIVVLEKLLGVLLVAVAVEFILLGLDALGVVTSIDH